MLGKIGVFVLFACAAGSAAAQVLTVDRTQSLEQVLANCDRATGLPSGVTPPPPSGPRHKVVINPDWLKRPDAKDMAAVFPASARAERVSGKATIRCEVGLDGHTHDCAIVEEAPDGKGFGAAAVKLAQGMRFVPRRVDCEPVDGGVVTIPINFSLP